MKHTSYTHTLTAANQSPGTHAGAITLIASTQLPKYHFVCADTQEHSVRVPSSTPNAVLGVTTDAALANEHVNVQLIACNPNTYCVQAGSDINYGQHVTSNDKGQAIAIEGSTSGHYQAFGIALSSVKQGALVECTPTFVTITL